MEALIHHMGRSSKKLLPFSLSLLLTLTAEEQDREVTYHLDEITIQADEQLWDDDLSKPYRVNQLEPEDFKRLGATDVKSALKEIPGVKVKDLGGFAKDFEIRGLSGERIATYVDGFKVSNQGITHSGGGESNLVDINNIESISVIKGSPAVLYDPGATGGSILIKTKGLRDDDNIAADITTNYDGGYDKTNGSMTASAGAKGFQLKLTKSKGEAKSYKVKDAAKLQQTITKSNYQQDRINTIYEIDDLSYKDEALDIRGGYHFQDGTRIQALKNDYEAEDIHFTHKGVDPTIIVYDIYEKSSKRVTLDRPSLGEVTAPLISAEESSILREANSSSGVSRVKLDTQAFLMRGQVHLALSSLDFGLEYRKDEAETAVYSEQDYWSSHLSWSFPTGDWDISIGLRGNHWKSKHGLKPGMDPAIATQLVGLAGLVSEQPSSFEPTYALGISRHLDVGEMLSFNASRTYREPTLYERYAFDTFRGDPNLKPEESYNFEFNYRKSSEVNYVSFSTYYNRFESFIGAKNVLSINFPLLNQFNEAVANGTLTQEEVDDRINEWSDFHLQMSSFDNVENVGFEAEWERYLTSRQKVGINTSMNRFYSNTPFLESQDNPLEFQLSYRQELPQWHENLWYEIKGRYVTDLPNVKQKDGFKSFIVGDLMIGTHRDRWSLNAGIRNLTDTVYHEAYMALDGLRRSFYVNFNLKLDKPLSFSSESKS